MRRSAHTRPSPVTNAPFGLFSILPISDPATRSLEGWVDIATLKSDLEAGRTREESSLGQLHGDSLRSFPKKTQAYTGVFSTTLRQLEGGQGEERWLIDVTGRTVITPDTPLEELEVFLDKDGVSFALVTDGGRKFVLGLVTRDDLQKCAIPSLSPPGRTPPRVSSLPTNQLTPPLNYRTCQIQPPPKPQRRRRVLLICASPPGRCI